MSDEIRDLLNPNDEDDHDEPSDNKKPENVVVNTKFNSSVTDDEIRTWCQMRDELSYTQSWQDIALNTATGSSYVVSTQ
jgi:hypothetical protein